MPTIKLELEIKADRHLVFDLARSIDLHSISTAKTNERAIAGTTTGLIGLGETVTWRAKHLGVYQTLSSKITAYDRPSYFVDEMLKGIFKSLRHEHHFIEMPYGTLLKDTFEYQSPLGPLGKLADFLFLEQYMTNFLLERNAVIKDYAESGKWQSIPFMDSSIYGL